MKGNNELHINQATMIEAMQLWASATFKAPPPIVLSVKSVGPAGEFVVNVKEAGASAEAE